MIADVNLQDPFFYEKLLKEKTVPQLQALAKEKGLKGYSKLKKIELIAFITKNVKKEPISKRQTHLSVTSKKQLSLMTEKQPQVTHPPVKRLLDKRVATTVVIPQSANEHMQLVRSVVARKKAAKKKNFCCPVLLKLASQREKITLDASNQDTNGFIFKDGCVVNADLTVDQIIELRSRHIPFCIPSNINSSNVEEEHIEGL